MTKVLDTYTGIDESFTMSVIDLEEDDQFMLRLEYADIEPDEIISSREDIYREFDQFVKLDPENARQSERSGLPVDSVRSSSKNGKPAKGAPVLTPVTTSTGVQTHRWKTPSN